MKIKELNKFFFIPIVEIVRNNDIILIIGLEKRKL
jgi:hypothetical protein